MSLTDQRPAGGFFARDRRWQPEALTPQYKTSVARSPSCALLSMPQTLSEVTGPVFGHTMIGPLDNDLILNFATSGESAIGPRIIVYGRVLDENGRGIPHTLLEFWQANAGGATGMQRKAIVPPWIRILAAADAV